MSIRKALAKAQAAWDDVEAHVTETYGLKGSLHFMYGVRYGWALCFRRSGRLVLAMYPNKGHLTVQIILGRAQIVAATKIRLPARVSAALKRAKDYPEGKWLFIPVMSQRNAEELRTLIALKMSGPGNVHTARQ